MSKLSFKSIKSIVLQILPIMLGVYLGLLANNWNEEKKSKDLEQQILVKLKAEVEENREMSFQPTVAVSSLNVDKNPYPPTSKLFTVTATDDCH